MSEGALTKWYRQAMGTASDAGLKAGLSRKHVESAGHGIRQYAESLLTGAVLGAVQAEGVTGLDVKGAPLDGILAGAGFVGSIMLADDENGLGHDARNVGASALSIFTFRKTEALLHEKKKLATMAGEGGEGDEKVDLGADEDDPIVAAARQLTAA